MTNISARIVWPEFRLREDDERSSLAPDWKRSPLGGDEGCFEQLVLFISWKRQYKFPKVNSGRPVKYKLSILFSFSLSQASSYLCGFLGHVKKMSKMDRFLWCIIILTAGRRLRRYCICSVHFFLSNFYINLIETSGKSV